MNYLRAKREKRNILIYITVTIFFIVIIIIFRKPLGHASRAVGNFLVTPFVKINSAIRDSVADRIIRKTETQQLIDEVTMLRAALIDLDQQKIIYDALNTDFSSVKNLPQPKQNIISAIISRPPIFGHDTIVVSAGSADGVSVGDVVSIDEHIYIGTVTEIFQHTSIVSLYSFSETKTGAVISDSGLSVELIGNGGGNFMITLPKGTMINSGVSVVLPQNETVVIATIGVKISDEHDSFTRYLATAPYNIQNIRFVSIQKYNE